MTALITNHRHDALRVQFNDAEPLLPATAQQLVLGRTQAFANGNIGQPVGRTEQHEQKDSPSHKNTLLRTLFDGGREFKDRGSCGRNWQSAYFAPRIASRPETVVIHISPSRVAGAEGIAISLPRGLLVDADAELVWSPIDAARVADLSVVRRAVTSGNASKGRGERRTKCFSVVTGGTGNKAKEQRKPPHRSHPTPKEVVATSHSSSPRAEHRRGGHHGAIRPAPDVQYTQALPGDSYLPRQDASLRRLRSKGSATMADPPCHWQHLL